MKKYNAFSMQNEKKRKAPLLFLALFSASCVFLPAQDFDSWDSFEDSSSDFSEGFGSPQQPLLFSGEGELQSRLYVDNPEDDDSDFISDFPLTATPLAKIGVTYSAPNIDADIRLKFEKSIINDYPQDMIDELTLRGYFGNFKLEAGKMKVVWGAGDKLHVIDNFNADDYTDFIIPDYIDRRISTPMFRALYAFEKNNLRLEGIWTPYMDADRFAAEGMWVPENYSTLKSTVTGVVTGWAADGESEGFMKAAQFDEDSLYPDTQKLKYSQAGIRLTGTAGSVDWGVSYYYGHYKQPSADLSGYIASSGKELPVLDYDWKQTFGLEAATILWHFNLRGELAYNLTADTAGDDPWVRNNSIAWLAGFDIDIPVSNININVQETGTYILNSDKIDDGDGFVSYGPLQQSLKMHDVDYDKAGYTNNKIVVNITDSLFNDKIAPEVTVLWGIERGDIVVQPKIAYKPNGNLTLTLSGMYIGCKDKDSEFYEWKHNSFVNFGVNCKF